MKSPFKGGTPLAGTLVTHSLMGFAHKADMQKAFSVFLINVNCS